MKRCILAAFALVLFSSPVFAEEMAVELRFESKPAVQQNQAFAATIKSFRPVRIQAFSDTRSDGETFLGELKVNGQPRKVQSRTAVSVYATDAFRKIYDDWGGAVSLDAPLVLKGEITQFSLEESDGYLARVGFHFLLKDDEGKVLWDGHSSGVVKGTGRTLTAETLSSLFNSLLRETYTELLEDERLVGVWSGKVQNTYTIRDSSPSSPAAGKES
ncbi:MAG TPA: hypothetical protein VFF53_00440 [Geobacteraceae bacterium]|nr:hypothetical protein [Geobacteraceae bacterium]